MNIRVNDKYSIGSSNPCLIIAEVGINHNGDLKLAKEMIDRAIACGVDAIKFQTFHAKEFISDPKALFSYYSKGKKITESMMEMFKRYEFSKKEWVEIFNYCGEKGLLCFSTPQNPSDLDMLMDIVELPLIKVGSDDLTNLSLLTYYASKGIPMIISSGMAYQNEIEDAVNSIKHQGNNDDLIVLHCVSSYPASEDEVNLGKMCTIRERFDVVVGFSDHTQGSFSAVVSAVLGAKVIEKHFTLNKSYPGPDHWFSADPDEFTKYVKQIRLAERVMGTNVLEPTKKEQDMRKVARRSIVAARNINKGQEITKDLIAYKRPGTGMSPKCCDQIIHKKAVFDIKKDQLINLEMVK